MKTLFYPTVCIPISERRDFRPTVNEPVIDLTERKQNFPTKTREDSDFIKWITAK